MLANWDEGALCHWAILLSVTHASFSGHHLHLCWLQCAAEEQLDRHGMQI